MSTQKPDAQHLIFHAIMYNIFLGINVFSSLTVLSCPTQKKQKKKQKQRDKDGD